MDSGIKKLRQRFVKDYNLPINIFDEKYFEYYRQLYPFFPNDVWESLVDTVGTKYNGNVNAWLDYCAKVRDNAILGTMETEEIANSKYLRQVIFGKMNPGRTIKVEKHIMGKIYILVHELFENYGYEFFSLNSDEIIFRGKFDEWKTIDAETCKKIENTIHATLGIDARVEHYRIQRLDIVNSNGNKVDAYVKCINGGEQVLKKVSTTFYPQVYKLWKGQDINLLDRGFFFEDQIAIFTEPLRFRKDEDNSDV